MFQAGENVAPDLSSVARPREASRPSDVQSFARAGTAPKRDARSNPVAVYVADFFPFADM
jgi:hypothetical protein